jgi:tetratricopeptide (TPR) repeat protein/class 3 adenylate cyclase
MSPERWQFVQSILASAIDSDLAARDALLDERCAGDRELREDVEALLAAHDRPGPVDQMVVALAPSASWLRSRSNSWEGRRVGRYIVLDLLGAGGMGVVHRARDERLGRHVALKFLTPHLSTQTSAKERFLVEARAAAALDHPSVCTIHEIGETDDGQLFMAMPLYEGETLHARLSRGRLSFEEASRVALQIAHGLARAHASGIVHRDLKPSNVMLLSDGAVKILDFGIAKMDDSSLSGDGAPFGTIAYMSPEHVRGGAVDHRADIWSLGVVLQEMLTGHRPFAGDDREAMARAILTDDPHVDATSHPDVPDGVDPVIRRALAKMPEHRYPAMTAFASDLEALSAIDGSRGRAMGPRGTAEMPPSERRRAAVLVSTVSGYHALVEHLAAADAERLVAGIRDLAVDVVGRHGGIVNQAIGEEIVSVFGVPIAHEDDELRAVRSAVELHARVRTLPVDTASTAAVRIQSALHAGPVAAQRLHEGPRRYALVGTTGQVAARLATAAGRDEILLSPDCQRIVAPFFHTVPSPSVVLDPDGGPVAPFRVTGPTGLETRLEASEQSGLTPYVGRQSELALLEHHVERACAGGGRLVTIVGDAGAGKSRLLHELRHRVTTAGGVRLLHGRCRAYGDTAPYSPFIEILRDALHMRAAAGTDSGAIVARIEAIDAALEPFVPLYLHLLSVPSDSHALPRHLQGEHLQAALLDALAALLVALASREPIVAFLEDWHWADAASRAALGRVAEIVPAHALLFVVTTRPGRHVIDEHPGEGTRIQLDPLERSASAAIIRSVLRADRVPGTLVQRLFERAGGNPFFLEQLCCALRELGAVAAPGGGDALVEGGVESLLLPDTVQAVIRTRLDNLEPDAHEVLRVAAVIGREFDHALLAHVLGPDVDLLSALEKLRRSGLLQQTSVAPQAGYRFTHVLTQEVSYDSLLAHQRKVLHGTVGRALERHCGERLDEHAASLARHFARAEAWPEAVRYGRRAANRASALSQFAEALGMLDTVLGWLARIPDTAARDDLKAELLLQQERECETLGLRGRQRAIVGELITHLSRQGPSARLAEAYLREGDLLTLLKQFQAADRALNTALRVSREWGDAALERNTLRSLGLLRWHEGRHGEALAITEHALSIARECDDELAIAGDLTNLGSILKSMGDYAAALPRLEEALAMPSLASDPKKLVYALHHVANVHRSMGNTGPALEYLRRADEIARTHLLPIQRSFHLTSIAHIDLQQGRVEDALRTYAEAVALSRRARHASGLAQSLRTLGDVLFGLGRRDEALPYLREAAGLFAQLEDRESEADLLSRVATALEDAVPSESSDIWRAAWTLRQQVGDADGELEALHGMARTVRKLGGAPDTSIPAFEAALALASRRGAAERQLGLRNTLGILEGQRGRYARALEHYEAALLLARDRADRVHEGLVLNSLGVTLTRLNRMEEARTALDESVAINRATGQRLLEGHALAALGNLAVQARRFEQAAQAFEASLECRRDTGDNAGQGWMWLRLAETRAALDQAEAAHEARAMAARLASETGDAALAAACARQTVR